jgi:predicted acyl esterase
VRRRVVIALVIAVLACAAPGPAAAAEPPPGSTWTEEYFPMPDGTRLHADILRPSTLPADAKTPVVLTVSPYTNHSAATALDIPDLNASGPSDRFYDLLEQAKLFERGYSYVMVDLPGFGGSGGCNDWGGPAEQGAVKAAVEWAASQRWSNGKVALYGKSYDGWTGLMGLAQRPKGLAAVVSQEPVVDGYRYLYMNRVRFPNAAGTPVSFQLTDATPGSLNDSPMYHLNSPPIAACYPLNIALQQQNDPESGFWRVRNLIPAVKGVSTPTFLMHGFLDSNTKADHVWALWNNLTGPNRGWFGQWNHVRGTDKDGNRYLAGRTTFVEETMRFLDHHVKGLPLADAPTDKDPRIVVNAFDGKWRAEERWPPSDSRSFTSPLKAGSYQDDGSNEGTGENAGNGIWTFSQPLPHPAHFAGMPTISIDVQTQLPEANFVANVYDVDRTGNAVLMSRGAFLIPTSGRYEFELYGQDWPVAAGHRIGVLMSSSNSEWWNHVPNQVEVTVRSASISLPFLTYRRDKLLTSPKPDEIVSYLAGATITVAPDAISSAQQQFLLPPALAPAPRLPARKTSRGGHRLTARLGALRRGGRSRAIVVYGDAPRGAQITVRLMRDGRSVGTRRMRTRVTAFRVRFPFSRAGRYAARVTAKVGRRTLRASARARRIR